MELGPTHPGHSRCVSTSVLAAPSYVFTVGRIAKLPGENEELLEEIGMTMDPEEGRLWVYDADDVATMAFTDRGLENLKELLAEIKR